MANQSRGDTPATAATTRRPRKARRKSRSGLISNIFALISMTFFGRLFIVGLFLALVMAINLLVSDNQFDFFFILLGAEMVVVAAAFWLRFLVKK